MSGRFLPGEMLWRIGLPKARALVICATMLSRPCDGTIAIVIVLPHYVSFQSVLSNRPLLIGSAIIANGSGVVFYQG
ncbi:MAG: hypothetical protein ACK5NN_03435 [Sphingomonadaceae bacterium]